MGTGGHLFIIDGDIKRLACDAWLLPTDEYFSITEAFRDAIGLEFPGRLSEAARRGWQGRGCLLWQTATESGEPDIWLGNVGATPNTPVGHYVGRAIEFVREASAHVRTRRPRASERPTLGLNVIGTGHGGQRRRRGEVLEGLIPALIAAAEEYRCDIVLVTYGQVMYAAAQSVRRSLIRSGKQQWSELSNDSIQLGDQLAARAKAGELVLFLGAGVSRNAGIPTWQELLNRLAEQLGRNDEWVKSLQGLDPRDQASLLSSIAPERFKVLVAKEMSSERYSLMHGLLASLPVKEVVTTNFDDLYERAATTAGRRISVIPGDSVVPGQPWVLKLHGTIGKDLVFTRSEYLGAMSSHVALRGLVQAMLLTRHMLFLGYSLSDEDFHQLVHEVRVALGPGYQGKLGTVLSPSAPSPAEQLWPELTFMSSATTGAEGGDALPTGEAARLLMILLDYVGLESASEVLFVADESLGKVKSEEEHELAEILIRLDALMSQVPADGWHEVRDFLNKFRVRGR